MTVLQMPLALVFDSVGPGEWLLIFGVILIVYGPRRLPEIARTLGRWVAKLQQSADLLRGQLNDLEKEVSEQPADRPSSPPDVPPAAAPIPPEEKDTESAAP